MGKQLKSKDDRGAVAVITAILVMFVALGMLSLTVDLGRITYDRSKLQNGADAVALAIASNCSTKAASGCSSTPTSAIQTLADGNANPVGGSQDLSATDRAAAQPPICFGNYTVTPKCSGTGNIQDLTDCLPIPSWITSANVPYVEVRTRTKTSSGTKLPMIFRANQSTTQITCSRAAWASAGSTGVTLPISMSWCDWNTATTGGTKWAPTPTYTPAPGSVSSPAPMPSAVGSYAVGIFLHQQGAGSCTGGNGLTYPGGFGFLNDTGNCTATISVNSTVAGQTGSSVPSSCKSGSIAGYLGKTVAIPIYDSFADNGSAGTYHIIGVSIFYLAGYTKLSAASPQTASVYQQPSTVCSGKCNGSTGYVWGWFTTGLLPVTASQPAQSGTNYGATQIYPAG